MTVRSPDDVMLPPSAVPETDKGTRLVAFVPIMVAMVGVAAILFGGIVAREPTTTIGKAAEVDTITTGSVAKSPANKRRALEMLDL